MTHGNRLIRTADAARGRWRGILEHFGMDASFLRNRHGPCPICHGHDRWRWDDKDGSGSYYCNHCDPAAGDGMDLLMRWKGWTFAEAAKEIDAIIGSIPVQPVRAKPDATARLARIGNSLRSAAGSINPVRLYLRSRHIETLPGDALRLAPAMRYYEDGKHIGDYPAMVAPVLSSDGTLATYHVTYLTPEGRKAPVSAQKKLISSPGDSGPAIRLSPIRAHIGIAEGIETALAVTALYGFPCWAVINANLMEQFIPPQGVRGISICADNDANFTGQKSAYALANRLVMSGYRARVLVPQTEGQDFADVLAAQQRAQA